MKEYYLKTEEIVVGYGNKPLMGNINIGVKTGEILTLIGPNGAGKSTILKSITRQLSLLGGTVYIGKEDMEKISGKAIAKKLSLVLTERIQSELMTCEEVVSSGRYPYTGRLGILSETDREEVSKALALVNGNELAGLYFDQISDGQKQRILLARAICQQPEMIVLDEPTSFLDIRHKLELLGILKRLVKERQIAVVMSLHELDLAQKVSDRIICVNYDGIEKCGTPEEIFRADYIEQLYGMTKGSYLAEYGLLEMERVEGKAQVFVIGGGGSGIPVYRKLQRMGIPFAAGVLSENDADYTVAKALAVSVITEDAFEPVSEKKAELALLQMKDCSKVICTVKQFGTMNRENERLLRWAQENGRLCNR